MCTLFLRSGFELGPEGIRTVRATGKWMGDKGQVEGYFLGKFEGGKARRKLMRTGSFRCSPGPGLGAESVH